MRWSLQVARVSGILIQVHWTFLILLLWVAMGYASQGADAAGVAKAVSLIIATFGCVVLHELGHALTAQRFHIHTKDITLLPIGGIARLERPPEEPIEEFLIAVAGPAVNVLIAAVLWGILTLTGSMAPIGSLLGLSGPFWVQLMWVNALLVAFNLLPAFPMDGGRILRSLLATQLDYAQATTIAATLGRVLAVMFGLLGIMSFNPFLIFIAVFVYFGAMAEAQHAQVRAAMSGATVRDVMLTEFQVLTGDESLADAGHALWDGSQQDFPVERGGRLLGMLFRSHLVAALKELSSDTPIADVMEPDYVAVGPAEPLHAAITRLKNAKCSSGPVIEADGRVVGLLTMENVAGWMMARSLAPARTGGDVLSEIFATD